MVIVDVCAPCQNLIFVSRFNISFQIRSMAYLERLVVLVAKGLDILASLRGSSFNLEALRISTILLFVVFNIPSCHARLSLCTVWPSDPAELATASGHRPELG